MPSAFSVANSPLTANGTLSVTGAGTTAQYVRGDGSLATLPSLTGFVPYTGATADVDLGTFNLTADVITGATGSFASNGGSNTFAINHSSGSGIALNITKGGNGEGLYINKTSGSGNAATIIGTLNATTLVKSGGTSSQYLMADGSVSTLTNPVTGTGTTNNLPKFTGASTIGNSNITDSGSLITLNSNANITGGLGINTSSLGGINGNFVVAKSITGGTVSRNVYVLSQILSDVTNTAIYFATDASTQAAAFTLNTLTHYQAAVSSFGAGSVVTTQIGFRAASSLNSATNNYGFKGEIASGTNRWNLYMDGTANNYLAGNTLLGTTTDAGFKLDVNGTARITSTLFGLTYRASSSEGYRVSNDNGFYSFNNTADTTRNAFIQATSTQLNIVAERASSAISFYSGGIVERMRLFQSGNLTIQNGGTFTDAGFRLDVNGTTRFIGTASSDTAPLGAELAAVTGTGTNWTLAGTNLNVGGYTHTTGSVDPLTTALAAVNGTYYQIAYTITGRTTGSITINYGGTSTSGITATGATGPLASSTAVLTITPTTDFNGTVVLSIKSIGTSVASSTFASSAGVIATEIRASDISSNLFFGRNNGRRNTTGTFNTFVGSQSGINNTTASFNTFLGTSTGVNNTTGGQNVFIGFNTGNANTTGGSNTIIGTFAGQANTTGGNNTFVGLNSGALNTTGTSNTFIGRESGAKNTTGNNNTFIGLSAGQENTTGTGNVVVGLTAAQLNTTGNDNSVFGFQALLANVGGSLNSVFGREAGRYIANKSTAATVLNNSIMIGYRTSPLADSQTNQIVIGHDAIGLGSNTTVIGNSSTLTTALYGDLVLGSTTPVASALLTMTSTTEGFLPPRMTTTQKLAIASPATGLVVFDTTLGKLCVFATTWQTITSI